MAGCHVIIISITCLNSQFEACALRKRRAPTSYEQFEEDFFLLKIKIHLHSCMIEFHEGNKLSVEHWLNEGGRYFSFFIFTKSPISRRGGAHLCRDIRKRRWRNQNYVEKCKARGEKYTVNLLVVRRAAFLLIPHRASPRLSSHDSHSLRLTPGTLRERTSSCMSRSQYATAHGVDVRLDVLPGTVL